MLHSYVSLLEGKRFLETNFPKSSEESNPEERRPKVVSGGQRQALWCDAAMNEWNPIYIYIYIYLSTLQVGAFPVPPVMFVGL